MDLSPEYDRIVKKATGAKCNICLRVQPLTEDHVPPDSCLEERNVEIEPFESRLRSDRPRLPWSQSGMRFETLCADCNSNLGDSFDPALAALARDVRTWLRSPILLGDRWSVRCDVVAVIKSLFGHLLAASSIDPDTVPDREMRAYLGGSRTAPAESTRVFYWVHDHPLVKVLRAAAMPAVRGSTSHGIGIFYILKFPPLGFVVTDLLEYEGLSRLDLPHPRQDAEVRFSRAVVHPPDWPERVDEENFVFVGVTARDSRSASPRPERRTKRKR